MQREVESLLAAIDEADSLPGVRDAVAAATASFVAGEEAALRVALERALSRQYEILRPLGRGATGAVFLARERALERFVAIKVLRPDLARRETRDDSGARLGLQRSCQREHSPTHASVRSGIRTPVCAVVLVMATSAARRSPNGCGSGPRLLAEALAAYQLADALECAHRTASPPRHPTATSCSTTSRAGQCADLDLEDTGSTRL